MNRIISLILTNSFVLQTVFISFGCKSFYQVYDGNELTQLESSKKRVLLKLTDQSELDFEPEDYIFVKEPSEFIYGIAVNIDFEYNKYIRSVTSIPQDGISSLIETIKTNSTTYQRYLLKDSTNIILEKGKIYNASRDLGSEYWIVLEDKGKDTRIIKNSEITEIQFYRINWITTSILLATGVGFIALLIAASQFAGFGSG